MAFITPASGFCLSPSGVTLYPTCGDIIEEGGKKNIRTEDGRNLSVDGSCASPTLPFFTCQIDRKMVDSGSFVTIVNTCTLPITITGFKNSDSARFSILEYPKYIGQTLYESGNTSQLPITLRPFEQTSIPTFFHPLRSELEHGTPGTFDIRDGDRFGATIDIYPGFPILNCTSSDTECDASFALTGEFICEKAPDLSILASNENFTAPDLTTIAKIENTYCLPRTKVMEFNTTDVISIENIYSGLSGLSLFYAETLNNISPNWSVEYPDMGVSGALGTFYHLVTGVMGGASDISVLCTTNVLNTTVLAVATAGIKVGQVVSGPGISLGATVVSIITDTSFVLSAQPTVGNLHTLVFSDGGPDSINSLLESSVDNYSVTSQTTDLPGRTVSGSYSPNNSTTFVAGGYTYTGMFFEMNPGEPAGLMSNQILFFNGQIIPGAAKDVRMFIAQSGDLTSEKLCDV